MNPEQQEKFAAHMRACLPKPEGAEWHALYFITDFAAKTLKRRVLHWRDLSLEDARTVMRAASKLKPKTP